MKTRYKILITITIIVLVSTCIWTLISIIGDIPPYDDDTANHVDDLKKIPQVAEFYNHYGEDILIWKESGRFYQLGFQATTDEMYTQLVVTFFGGKPYSVKYSCTMNTDGNYESILQIRDAKSSEIVDCFERIPEPARNPVPEGSYIDKNTYVYSVNEAESYLNYTLGTPYIPEGTELEKIKISSDKRKATIYYSNGLEVKHNPMGINFNNTHYIINPERDAGKVFYDFGGTFAEGYEIDEPNRPHYSTIIIHRDDRIYVRATMEIGLDELLKMIEPMDLNVPHVQYTPTPDYVMGAPEPEPIPEPEPKIIPTKNHVPPEDSFDGVFGIPITESEFDSIISYTPVKLSESNTQNLELIEIRINANTNVHYLYSSQTINLNELKNKQNFFDAGGVVVETVYLTNPNGVYTRLANDVNLEIEYLGTVPIRYHFYPEEYNSLLLYPDNQRLVYIQSIEDIDKIKQLASDIKLKNDSLNLDDYLMTDWKLEEPQP